MAKLEVKNLSISFRTNNGAVRAVRDISFSLNEGETLAIAGESGSGKSVTSRAIMGILAGNAMVDNGEIIYDGKDLLKISEEDFHTLRGHRLSMVFQDPLSALNPIMRIGKQLTEAMILNNKERRRDGRELFNKTLALLEKNMVAAKAQAGQPGAKEAVHEKIRQFDQFVSTGVKLDEAYRNALETTFEVTDGLDEMDNALARRDEKNVREIAGRIAQASKGTRNPYVVPEDDAAYTKAVEAVKSVGSSYTTAQADAMRAAQETLRGLTKAVQEKETPNFFCIGYHTSHGGSADPNRQSVAEINKAARKALDDGFMTDFLKDVEQALTYARAESDKAKRAAIDVLKQELPVFQKTPLVEKECRAAAQRASAAVEEAIDKLALDKDNMSYVFKSSLTANINRYFRGVSYNPREEKRYQRDVAKHDKLAAQGKNAPTAVPMNLIDLDVARGNMTGSIEGLIAHYQDMLSTASDAGSEEKAVEMIDYLKARASDYAFTLSKGMAKHRAIELMKEVGIPEPYKRFHQYPFEFSGGMRQRIVIAIALSANPDVLICDEPTTALDVTIQAQILELINRLKVQRRLSVIFITHDLGVVANMADRIAIMYAGKIVEYGTADDVFYDPRHPYTWALLSSMPDLETKEKLEAIPGTPPDMIIPPKGDAFAARNRYAMKIDFEEQPPMFQVSPTHWAATWLLHPGAPKVEPPAIVTERINRMMKKQAQTKAEGGLEA